MVTSHYKMVSVDILIIMIMEKNIVKVHSCMGHQMENGYILVKKQEIIKKRIL